MWKVSIKTIIVCAIFSLSVNSHAGRLAEPRFPCAYSGNCSIWGELIYEMHYLRIAVWFPKYADWAEDFTQYAGQARFQNFHHWADLQNNEKDPVLKKQYKERARVYLDRHIAGW